MRHAAKAALAALLFAASPAAAGIHDTWLAQAHDIAMWRFPTVCQPVSYDDVHKPIPGDWYGLARIGGDPCTVYLRSDWRRWPYWLLCGVVVHETGHLFGLGHASNPALIMSPYGPESGWPPCQRHSPPQHPFHGKAR